MDLTNVFSGTQGVLLAGLLGVVVVSMLFNVKQLKVAEHKWAGAVAQYLSALGLSPTVTTPFSDIAAGDVPGAIGAGLAAEKYLIQRDNRLKEGLSVLRKLSADHPKEVTQFFNDFLAGKDDATLMADAQGTLKDLADPGPGPVLKQLQHVGDVINSLGTNADLSSIINLIGSNPLLVPIAPALTKALTTVHDIGAASVPPVPADAAAAAKTVADAATAAAKTLAVAA